MNGITPSLPSLRSLPFYVACDGLIGYVCGIINSVNPSLTATILVVRTVANTLFYHLANYLLGGQDLKSHKIFLFTSTTVNILTFIVLRELSLIGRLCSWLLGSAMFGYFINRVCYIQDQERQLIFEEESNTGL